MTNSRMLKTRLLVFSVFILGTFMGNYFCKCNTETKNQNPIETAAEKNRKIAEKTRKTEYPIEDLIKNRWSPRAMSGEAITTEEISTLFEAAKWAASSYNNQPWRFIYALKDTQEWESLYNLMVPFNQMWAKNAGALIVVISKNTFDHNGEFMPTHSFDAGAACANMALQGSAMGLVVHGMGGFDYAKAKKDLNVPEGYTVEAMFAIGKPGNIEVLPEQMRSGEAPSGRKALSQIACQGKFNF